MANPFVKGWRYLMALFGAKIDEYADPKVQIQQAIDEAKVQHQTLVKQAAAVIGNQRQLEMRLSRHMSEVEKWQGMARQGLVLADQARTDGEDQKAREYERAAQSAATQLVTSEQAVEDLKALHDQALNAAQQARTAVENNKMLLEEKLAQRTKLLSQLEQAKMQETVASSLESMSALAAPGNTPSLDEVRDKIEQRYATAMGRAELASDTVEGRMIEVQRTTLDLAGQSRLAQIRASMSGGQITGGAERPAVEAGPDQAGGGAATVSRLDEIRASLANKDGGNGAGGTGAGGTGAGGTGAGGTGAGGTGSGGKGSGDAAAAT
jgi:phage shock protein A